MTLTTAQAIETLEAMRAESLRWVERHGDEPVAHLSCDRLRRQAAAVDIALAALRAAPAPPELPDEFEADGVNYCGHCYQAIKHTPSELLAAALASDEPKAAPAPFDAMVKLAKEATNGWACYARTKAEHAEIARLHSEINKFRASPSQTQAERELMTLAHGDRLLPDTSGNAQIIAARIHRLPAAPAPEGETPHVSMEVLNGVTVAGARAYWALKDLETRHERLRVAIMRAVSAPELGHPNPTWEAIRADLAAAFNADPPAPEDQP
jgi:hypothetical protein